MAPWLRASSIASRNACSAALAAPCGFWAMCSSPLQPQQLRVPEALARARRYLKTFLYTFEPIRGIPIHEVCVRGETGEVGQKLVRSRSPRFGNRVYDPADALFVIPRHRHGPPFERR